MAYYKAHVLLYLGQIIRALYIPIGALTIIPFSWCVQKDSFAIDLAYLLLVAAIMVITLSSNNDVALLIKVILFRFSLHIFQIFIDCTSVTMFDALQYKIPF